MLFRSEWYERMYDELERMDRVQMWLVSNCSTSQSEQQVA